MSTSRILLPITTAILPTSNPATRSTITSSSAATANCPKVTYDQLAFNDTTDQFAMWTFRTPADYLSGGTLTVKLSAAANTGNVVMSGGFSTSIDNFGLWPAATFFACDVSATTAVPGTIGMTLDLSWALTMTTAAGSRLASVFLGRRASIAADTLVGNANVTAAEFSYTS